MLSVPKPPSVRPITLDTGAYGLGTVTCLYFIMIKVSLYEK